MLASGFGGLEMNGVSLTILHRLPSFKRHVNTANTYKGQGSGRNPDIRQRRTMDIIRTASTENKQDAYDSTLGRLVH